jgi:hypothetical protein
MVQQATGSYYVLSTQQIAFAALRNKSANHNYKHNNNAYNQRSR